VPRLIPGAGPQRTLAVSTFANSIGSGIYLTAAVLYFTQAVHLRAPQVGLGLSVAGLASLAVGVSAGHLADRWGPRGVYAATLVVRALATAGFTVANSFWPFVLTVSLAAAAQAAGLAARSPLVKRHGGKRPQQFRAYLRSITNVGISLGALAAGWAVQAGTRTGYDILIAGNVAAFAAAAAVLRSLPPLRPLPSDDGPRWTALRDRPYLALAALDGVMSVQYKVLTVAIPLWLVAFTHAPRWLISAAMLTNTAIVIGFQVPASRNVASPIAAGHAYRRAGAAFLVSCAVISLSAQAPAWTAIALITTAVVVHTIGELWQAAAGFEVSFALAPDHATGQYLGVFGMGTGLADAIGPTVLVALCITWGRPGWYVLGALFALTGCAAPAVVRRAERRTGPAMPPQEAAAAHSALE